MELCVGRTRVPEASKSAFLCHFVQTLRDPSNEYRRNIFSFFLGGGGFWGGKELINFETSFIYGKIFELSL